MRRDFPKLKGAEPLTRYCRKLILLLADTGRPKPVRLALSRLVMYLLSVKRSRFDNWPRAAKECLPSQGLRLVKSSSATKVARPSS